MAGRLWLDRLRERPLIAALDELHRYRGWQSFLEGFFDTHGEFVRLLVTGSSRLEVARRGADSLMGRYFPYRMHPLSVAEVSHARLPERERAVRPPTAISAAEFEALWRHGGFPSRSSRANCCSRGGGPGSDASNSCGKTCEISRACRNSRSSRPW